MLTRDEIIQALGQLDPASFEDVLNAAYQNRSGTTSKEVPARPGPQAGPEEFARWLAQRHLTSDAAIEKVVYLPEGAPKNEIRLLEINRFLSPSDDDPIEPLDFTPDNSLPFKVFVADITRDQWERIREGAGPDLPEGWDRSCFTTYSRSGH